MVSASMTVQHTKWLQEAQHLSWRTPVASLNILLTSTCWRNDHNGFSHQGPGLIDVMLSKRGTVARIYLPPDANSLLSVADRRATVQHRDRLNPRIEEIAGHNLDEPSGRDRTAPRDSAPQDESVLVRPLDRSEHRGAQCGAAQYRQAQRPCVRRRIGPDHACRA